jgi:hypothetical protein
MKVHYPGWDLTKTLDELRYADIVRSGGAERFWPPSDVVKAGHHDLTQKCGILINPAVLGFVGSKRWPDAWTEKRIPVHTI